MKTLVSKIGPVWEARIRRVGEIYCLVVLPLAAYEAVRVSGPWLARLLCLWLASVAFAAGRWRHYDAGLDAIAASTSEATRVANELMDKVEANDAVVASVLERRERTEIN